MKHITKVHGYSLTWKAFNELNATKCIINLPDSWGFRSPKQQQTRVRPNVEYNIVRTWDDLAEVIDDHGKAFYVDKAHIIITEREYNE
jgi:hypothetical protein